MSIGMATARCILEGNALPLLMRAHGTLPAASASDSNPEGGLDVADHLRRFQKTKNNAETGLTRSMTNIYYMTNSSI